MTPELQVIARYRVADGRVDEVLDLIRAAAERSRQEPGNLSYVAHQSIDDPRDVVLLERYRSPADFAAHRETDHFRDIVLGRIVPLLESRVAETFEVEPPG
jgi:quinol monooxygenase YgiN